MLLYWCNTFSKQINRVPTGYYLPIYIFYNWVPAYLNLTNMGYNCIGNIDVGNHKNSRSIRVC